MTFGANDDIILTDANDTNKGQTMKTVLEFAGFVIGAEIILFTIFGIIPELLKLSL